MTVAIFHKIRILIFKFRTFECSDFEQCSIFIVTVFMYQFSILNGLDFENCDLLIVVRILHHLTETLGAPVRHGGRTTREKKNQTGWP